MILVIAETRDGKLNRASWEAVAAAQQLASRVAGETVKVAVPGGASLAGELASADVAEVLAVEAAALEPYTADGYTDACAQVIAAQQPAYVIFAHTYQARDFVPKLAARLQRPLITDVVGFADAAGRPAFTRLVFQGKMAADVTPEGEAPCLVTVQAGAFPADGVRRTGEALKANGVAVEQVELQGNRGHLDGVLNIKQAEKTIAEFLAK